MRVHSYIGPGFPEIVYHRCLKIEFEKEGLSYLSEFYRDLYYEGKLVGKRRLDLLVENKALLELKATSEVPKSGYSQIINYLKIFKIEVGLLLNFGKESLEFKRFVNSNMNEQPFINPKIREANEGNP